MQVWQLSPAAPPTPFLLPTIVCSRGSPGFLSYVGMKNSTKSKSEDMKIVNNPRCFPSRKVYDLTGLKRFVNQTWNLKRDQQFKAAAPRINKAPNVESSSKACEQLHVCNAQAPLREGPEQIVAACNCTGREQTRSGANNQNFHFRMS